MKKAAPIDADVLKRLAGDFAYRLRLEAQKAISKALVTAGESIVKDVENVGREIQRRAGVTKKKLGKLKGEP